MSEQEHEQPMSEQESLALITSMIQTAKSHFHESGTSAILWGAVIGFCGIYSFVKAKFGWDDGHFDVWYLAAVALIPQIFIAIRERRRKVVKTHMEAAIDAIWTVYGISVFAMIFYINIIPGVNEQMLVNRSSELLLHNVANGTTQHILPYTPSAASLLLILYAIPTLATGIARRFNPMLIGGIICYGFFVASCFTSNDYDSLMMGFAAICNWLVPGFILRKRYLKAKLAKHV